jgi:hypothetical protein
MEKKQDLQATPHRFDRPVACPLTWRKRTEIEYASHFIPFLKHLEGALGKEKVVELLREMSLQGLKEFADKTVKTFGGNDLSLFKKIFDPDNPDLQAIMTMQVIESTETTYTVNVSECLLAEVFRKAGAAEYGDACLCLDVPFTTLVNPHIGLDLDGTLMLGDSGCLHRFYVKA